MVLAASLLVNRRRPPRIDGFDYVGAYAYFLTICTFQRRQWFSNRDCATDAIREFLQTNAHHGFEVLAYCLMPDHLHGLVEGQRADSDFLKCASLFKQHSGFNHARKYGGRL
jgi:putative transposase